MHLERLLVATLLAMFITATVGLLAAASKIATETESIRIMDNWFLVGSSALYAILAGYYYFMLTQFYAVVVSLMMIDKDIVQKISPLWDFFKPDWAPVAGLWHQLHLLSAATVPLLITIIALVAISIVLPEEKTVYVWACVVFHIALFFVMIWAPFRKFIRGLRDFAA